jgi:D-lactate dehydrogenase (cytochrome)
LSASSLESVAARFRPIVGDTNVLVSEPDRTFYSHDIAGAAPVIADAVLRPSSIDALRETVRIACASGIAIYPRGGGMSYTAGYLPQQRPSVLLDLGALNRVREIDVENERVIVEAGCTWGKLFEALESQPRQRRVPSFGPLSGHAATVGGGVSQNGGFFGGAQFGPLGDSVLGISAVIADGSLLGTGVFAGGARHQGPDLTALFVGDCGALGIKAEIALRLVPRPAITGFLSFAFDDQGRAVDYLAALAEIPGVAEAMGFDAVAHANLARTGFSVLEGAAFAADLLGASGNLTARIASVIKAARAGKAVVADLKHSVHLAIDAPNAAHCELAMGEAAAAALDRGARPIPDVIPRVTRARPFRPIKALLGPEGENWLPVHGVFALGAAKRALDACNALLAENRSEMERHAVRATVLTVLSGRSIVIEPQFFWPDSLSPFHRRACQPNQVASYASRPANEPARAAVHRLRRAMADLMDSLGATHYQIGRYYRLPEQSLSPLRAIKRAVDPENRINPGALGL